MRLPPAPPKFTEIAKGLVSSDKDTMISVFRNLSRHDVKQLLQMANDQYLHWHKFRYKPRPSDVEVEYLWAMLDMQRETQRRNLSLSFSDFGHQLKFWIPPKHQEWLHHIDRDAGGRMPAMEEGLPRDDRYLFGSLMEEAIASSQLEGASTTREIAKKMLRSERKPRSRPEQMIVNNYRTILELRDSKTERLTPDLLCHIQRLLTENTLDDPEMVGRFRTVDDNVAVIDNYTLDVMHKPPSAVTVQYRIEEICEFATEHSKPFIHPVLKAIILHFAIGFVHPFVDGNGRTARAIFYWYMLKRGYWPFQYLPISRIFIKAPSQYARAYLYTETDGGDVTYFIHYHLQVIRRAINELHDHFRVKQKEYKEGAAILDAYPHLNHRQTTLICYALKNPDQIYTIRHHQGKHHISYATARSDLLNLEKRDFLTSSWEGKRLLFSPAPDLLKKVKSAAPKIRRENGQQKLPI